MPSATHPIDALFRDRLRTLKPNQKDIAKLIGRSQGWLNKYMNGAGKATIDDIIRLAAIVLLGVATAPLTRDQRKLLHAWESLPPDGRKDVMRFVSVWRKHRLGPQPKSSARAAQKARGTSDRSPGTR